MSASILFEPVDPKPKSIGVWAPSSFQEAMERAGLGLPCELGTEAEPILKGMAAAWGPDTGRDQAPNPYYQILEKIERHGRIRLWAEH